MDKYTTSLQFHQPQTAHSVHRRLFTER